MSERVKLKSGLIIVKRSDGLFVGHLHDHEIFADQNVHPIISMLREWTPIDQLLALHSAELTTVTRVMARLEGKNFLERSDTGASRRSLIISHMNELGTLLSAALVGRGYRVTTLDNRSSQIADVCGQYLRISDAGQSFHQILAAQIREIRNSGIREQTSAVEESEFCSTNGVLSRINQEPRQTLVLITTYPEPELLASLMEAGLDHFCAFTTPSGGIIGPFVRPGVTPCFHCLELTRSCSDGEWQKVAATLFIERFAKLEMANVLLTTALLLNTMRQVIEGEIPHHGITGSFTISFDDSPRSPNLASISERGWSWGFHPECSCHWQ
jgi:DNA-binding MarR family transcriptional regulator